MTWDWERLRVHFARLLADAQATRGLTQQDVADSGGLAGQNVISRLLRNPRRGPSVETFIRAIAGLGMKPSDFFAALEAAAADASASGSAGKDPDHATAIRPDHDIFVSYAQSQLDDRIRAVALEAVSRLFIISAHADLSTAPRLDDAGTARPSVDSAASDDRGGRRRRRA